DRRQVRVRYVLAKEGLDWFRRQVERLLGVRLAPAADIEVSGIADHLGWHTQEGGRSFLGLFIENGRIRDAGNSRLRSAIRRVVETLGAGVRFTPQQNLLISDVPDRCRGLVERILADHGVTADAMPSPVR